MVSTGVFGLVHWLTKPPSPAPRLEVDAAIYKPPRYVTSPFKIDIELRNTGHQLAVITSLQLVVQRFVRLPICFSQGNLPATADVHTNMPVKEAAGRIITIPVHQQVGPGRADRFIASLRVPLNSRETLYLYRMRLSLSYDSASTPTVGIGEAIIALPVAPNNQYFWTRQDAADHGSRMSFMGSQAPKIRSCMIANSQHLRNLLALPGEKPGMTEIPAELAFTP
jgi:hypothetical protein